MLEYVMLADYPEFLKSGPGSIVSRAVTVPHLFAPLELDREMTEDRPFIPNGRKHVYSDREPWIQLSLGVKLISETKSFRTRKGKTYFVDITKYPDDTLVWELKYSYWYHRPLAKGTDLESLWAELEARMNTRRRT